MWTRPRGLLIRSDAILLHQACWVPQLDRSCGGFEHLGPSVRRTRSGVLPRSARAKGFCPQGFWRFGIAALPLIGRRGRKVRSAMTVLTWSDERVEQLKKLWASGLSASQIAAELGNVTRTAVIGKVHRLCLSWRAQDPPSAAPR